MMAKGAGGIGRNARRTSPVPAGGDYGALIALNKARRPPKPGVQSYAVTVMSGDRKQMVAVNVRGKTPEEAKAKALERATRRGVVRPVIINYSYEVD